MPESLFSLDHVTKRYGKVVALNDMTVDVPIGAIGLLGPNGAGKTTMIRTMLGLVKLSQGRAKVLGLNVGMQTPRIRQLVGFVPEDECLFPGLQGVEFVAYAGELAGLPDSDAMRRAHEMLDYVGLGEARYRRAESYSTGMKQRLKIAAGIVHDPKLLILDEPTNGLDPAGREEIIALARDLAHNKGMSIIFSSHILPDVEAVCKHIVLIGKGKLLASGTMEELRREDNRLISIRCKDGNDILQTQLEATGRKVTVEEDHLVVELSASDSIDAIWQLARAHQIQIRYVKPRRRSLEDVFLSAVAG